MKTYQDTETGQLHAFDDGVDPFKLNNRNIPSTLSETVIPKPSDSHIWFKGAWVKDTEVPKGYKPPTSSVPSYNTAWIAFLNPYTIVLPEGEEKFEISLEQINTNSYDNDKLSEVVATLPLGGTSVISALISYDGAIAIPRNTDHPSDKKAAESINRIFCAILLGGEHAEVIGARELLCGSLENQKCLFVFNPTVHSRFRHKWASLSERIQLMHPRTVRASDLRKAYDHGLSVINAIKNFSPFFLLHGYSAMVSQNRSDALSSLWIVVEQLTWCLWKSRVLCSPSVDLKSLVAERKLLKKDSRTSLISVKHELLLETKFLSDSCFAALSAARDKRNDLVHEGLIPDFEIINNLWRCMPELFESASGISEIGIRRLVPIESPDLGFPEKSNFDEWHALSEKFNF